MYILILINFLFCCSLSVVFFMNLKEKDDEIQELYDIFYEELQVSMAPENRNKKNKGRSKVIEL